MSSVVDFDKKKIEKIINDMSYEQLMNFCYTLISIKFVQCANDRAVMELQKSVEKRKKAMNCNNGIC